MKEYEILYIIKPNLDDETTSGIDESLKDVISKNDGEILFHNDWGIRDLATEFDKFTQGHYIQIQFKATNKTLDELREYIRVNEDILRHLIVDMKSVKKEFETEEVAG